MFSGQVLSAEQIDAIQRASEDVLERSGCKVFDEAALALCRNAGAKVDDASGRVRLPRELLRELVSQAPSSYTVTGLDGIERRPAPGPRAGHVLHGFPGLRLAGGPRQPAGLGGAPSSAWARAGST